MSLSLDGPRVPAANGPARQLVVLLHGYGADGGDLIELAAQWRRDLPQAAFVAPHAPGLIPGQPMGRQWFGLDTYDPGQLRRDPQHAAALYAQLQAGAESAAPVLHDFLERELARHRLGAEQLALVGFSQGTMMALHVGLLQPLAPAAILGFSGALVGAQHLTTRASHARVPQILLIHGAADDIVPPEALFAALNGLGSAGIPARWHLCPGLPHGIDAEGMQLGGIFLRQALAA